MCLHLLFGLTFGFFLQGCNSSAGIDPVSEPRINTASRNDQFLASAANANTWIIVGLNGVVVSGDTAGTRRKRMVLPENASLLGAAACPDGTFAALDFYRKVWISDADASSWAARELKTTSNPLALTCDPRGRLWVVGSNSSILRSADSGKTWSESNQGNDVQFTTIQFVDADFGIIAGEFGAFLTTMNGGATWQERPKVSADFYPYTALFADRNIGWIAGVAGSLMATTDGGKTWIKQQNPANVSMYGLAKHAGRIFALGDNGRMLRLGARGWVAFEHGQPVFSFLRSAISLDPEHMLICGGAGASYVIAAGSTASQSSGSDANR
jgi:photosystem II stability/assembly factor-like uncharacterized protein